MSEEKISYKVSKDAEFKDSVYYSVQSWCGHPDETIEIQLVKECYRDNAYHITLNFLGNARYYACYECDNWFRDKWYRIKGAFKLLFTGKLRLNHGVCIDNTEHIQSFINALQEGMEILKTGTYNSLKEQIQCCYMTDNGKIDYKKVLRWHCDDRMILEICKDIEAGT